MGRRVPHDGSVTRGQGRPKPGAPDRRACLRASRKGGRHGQPFWGGFGVEDIRRYGSRGTPQLRPPRGWAHRHQGPTVVGVQPAGDALRFRGIVVIGAVAFVFDLMMRKIERALVPWKGNV